MISIAKDLGTLNQAVDLTLPKYVWIICFYWLLLPTKFDPKLWSRNLLMLLPSTCSNHSSLLLFFMNVAQAPSAFYAPAYLPGHLSHIFQCWPAILIWFFLCSCGHISLKTVNSSFSQSLSYFLWPPTRSCHDPGLYQLLLGVYMDFLQWNFILQPSFSLPQTPNCLTSM